MFHHISVHFGLHMINRILLCLLQCYQKSTSHIFHCFVIDLYRIAHQHPIGLRNPVPPSLINLQPDIL